MRLREQYNMKQLSIVAVAYGLFLACTSIVLWGGYAVLIDAGADAFQLRTAEYFMRNAAFPVALFGAALIAYNRPKQGPWRSPLAALALFEAGALFIVAQRLFGLDASIAYGACALLLGCGSGLGFCCLQDIIASLKVYEAGLAVFAAAGISCAVYIAMELLPRTAMMIFGFAVLIPATAVAMAAAQRTVPCVHPAFDTIPSQQIDRCRQAAAESWPSLLCIAFTSFAVGIIRVDAIDNTGLVQDYADGSMVGLLAAAIVLLATWKTIYERIKLSRLYQVVFPLTATIFLLLPLFDGQFRHLLVLVAFVVFSIVSSLMVVSCARVARNQCLQPVLVYGMFAGTVYAAQEVGSLLGFMLNTTGTTGFASLSVVALIAIYAMSLAMNTRRGGRGAAESSTATATTSKAAGTESAIPPAEALDIRLSQQCDALVAQYGLSARETDVLRLLARGRDVPYIAEELVISKNTVRTHMRNIFQKTGVHSRQEVIDLLETVEQ